MSGKAIILALCLVLSVAGLTTNDRIKHIIVVMEENRSFDHLLGYLKNVNGVSDQTNPVNATNPREGKVRVSPTAKYVNDCDPDHSTPATTYKVFGQPATAAKNFTDPTMSGFVEWQQSLGDGASLHFCDVMEGFPPHRVPIISTLAEEYAVFDAFHASHPGPTWPNRLFMLTGTSAGLTETGIWFEGEAGKMFTQKAFYDQVAERGQTWKNYYNDTPWEMFLETVAKHPENTVPMTQFFEDARDGTFPTFAFINPRLGINETTGEGSNDQHPDHDVAAGEQYLKDIYEAVRSSPAWNETLLIVTYDEHGGFFDHVPTPLNVPEPSPEIKSYPDKNFRFDRLGVRIPTIAISPWVKKGTVVSSPPPEQRPAPNSAYELTSIMATARKLISPLNGLPALTARDEWAATFEHIFNLPEPRNDCPVHLPPAPPVSTENLAREGGKKINDLQRAVMEMHSHVVGEGIPHHVKLQREFGPYVSSALEQHKKNLASYKSAKRAMAADVVGEYNITTYVNNSKPDPNRTSWHVITATNGSSVPAPHATIAHELADGTWMCLDSGSTPDIKPGTTVGVAPCLFSRFPQNNSDPNQHWIRGTDLTIRPASSLDLCLTCHSFQKGIHAAVTLDICGSTDPVYQNWATQGIHPGYGKSYAFAISVGVTTLHLNKIH